jgi:predicted transcriptional regulator of viral defense system
MAEPNYPRYKKIFAAQSGVLRASTAIELGVPKHVLYKMAASGELVREAQGVYRLKEAGPLGNPDLVQVGLRVPRAVICLISALYFHGLTTQIPHQVYFALPRDVKTPKMDYPPIRVFHFSGESFRAGVEEQSVDGIKVKIYDREKTLADCFKFREKIGPEIAVEALKDYFKQPHPNPQAILQYARINRVEKVMRPYLEALI